jgi:hypothetical protein
MGKATKSIKSLICLGSAIFLVLAAKSLGLSATGVLLMVKGKVTVSSHGAAYPAKTGLRLKPGDTINSLGGTVSVLLSDGRMRTVDTGSSFTLSEEQRGDWQDPFVARVMDTIRDTAHRGRGPTTKGMVRGEKEIVVVYPYNSCVLSDELRFEWEGVEGLDDVGVFLKSPSPVYKYSFKAGSGENRASLPEDAPPLVPGHRYYWRVKGFQKTHMKPYASRLRWFAILSPQDTDRSKTEMRRIDAMDGTDQNTKEILRANLLISHGLYHRAVRILRQSLQQLPEDEGLKELLIGLLLKMKNFEEAEKYMNHKAGLEPSV